MCYIFFYLLPLCVFPLVLIVWLWLPSLISFTSLALALSIVCMCFPSFNCQVVCVCPWCFLSDFLVPYLFSSFKARFLFIQPSLPVSCILVLIDFNNILWPWQSPDHTYGRFWSVVLDSVLHRHCQNKRMREIFGRMVLWGYMTDKKHWSCFGGLLWPMLSPICSM